MIIGRVSLYDQQTATIHQADLMPAVHLDPYERRHTYQVKLTPGEVKLIGAVLSAIGRSVEIKLPRWVGQNKKRE